MPAASRLETRAPTPADPVLRPERIDPLEDRRWSAFVERAETASVFHHPAWLRLLSEQYGYAIHAPCVTDPDGEVLAGLPVAEIRSRLTGRRGVSLPFSDLCPPLVADPTAREPLAEAIEQERSRLGVPLEVRGAHDRGHVLHRFHQHVLALRSDYEEVERGFSKSQVRAAVRKARKAGVTVERRTDREALDSFYELHLATRRRLGVPTQPKRFIRRFEGLFADGLGFVMLARLGGRPAAAAVYLTFNGTLTYKYGASDARFLKQRPNNLLFAEAIRWGCENGFATLDFGRTELGNEGLARFKRNWGASERPLSYTYAPEAPESGGEGRLEQLMHAALKRSPALAGRLVGEALYRHFG